MPVARAFSHFLTLANIAEQHHRVRRRRDYLRDPSSRPQPGSLGDLFARLTGAGLEPEAIADAIASLRIELVLTAHPTAITRPTLVAAQLRIAEALARRDRADLTRPERDEIDEDLRREIAAMWGTQDLRPRRPTPGWRLRHAPPLPVTAPVAHWPCDDLSPAKAAVRECTSFARSPAMSSARPSIGPRLPSTLGLGRRR